MPPRLLTAGRTTGCASAAALLIILSVAGTARAATTSVRAYPGPHWLAASPRTGITFEGATSASLADLVVRGSRSGEHPGALRRLRAGRGVVFTPARPFDQGERVIVDAGIPVAGAEGDSFAFQVADLVPLPSRMPDNARVVRTPPPSSGRGVGGCVLRRKRYHTYPGFRPVALCRSTVRSSALAQGRLFVTPRAYPRTYRGDQHAVMMLTRDGRAPLWYQPLPDIARDFKTVTYGGERMLAFYQWMPHARAYYALLDDHYRRVASIRAGNGYMVNTHDLHLTAAGTAYLMAYVRILDPRCDCRVSDVVLQEIDVATGDVLWEWHAVDHVALEASYAPPLPGGFPWDYFHANSIEPPARAGSLLVVSARNTSSVYGIDRRTGDVRWILGGRQDQFGIARDHPRWRFCAQHDARRLPSGDITLFDNGGLALGDERACPLHLARAMRFRLDRRHRRVTLVAQSSSRPASETGAGYYVPAMGSARRQSNGNWLVSWGTNERLTEVTPGGRVVLALHLGRYSYRGIRSAWTGQPVERPRVAAVRSRNGAAVWAAWNGATEVARWRLLAGSGDTTLDVVATHAFVPFETAMRAPSRSRFVAVEALARDGSVLGSSAVLRVGARVGHTS